MLWQSEISSSTFDRTLRIEQHHRRLAAELTVARVAKPLYVRAVGGHARVHIAELRSDICVIEPVEHLAVRLERRGNGAVRVDDLAAHGLSVVRQLEISEAVPGKPRHTFLTLFGVAVFVALNLPGVAGIKIQRPVRVYFLAAADGYISAVLRRRDNGIARNILAHVVDGNRAEVSEFFGSIMRVTLSAGQS